jgi:hypothetical protein
MRHIIVGYGVVLNELDDFGTALSRELVESSIPLLRKYPAVRLMHKEPFGHIVFDETIEGFQTHLDGEGFFVVAEIGANFEKEFSLIKRGGWGFSWGMFPSEPPVSKIVGGRRGLVFEKGRVYEISVVDVPAQSGASLTVLRGATASHEPKSGFRSQLDAALGTEPMEPLEHTEPEMREASGFLAQLYASTKDKKMTVERQNQAFSIIQRQVDFDAQLPEICGDDCIIKRHCGAYPSQVGSTCVKKMEQFKNDKFIQK